MFDDLSGFKLYVFKFPYKSCILCFSNTFINVRIIRPLWHLCDKTDTDLRIGKADRAKVSWWSFRNFALCRSCHPGVHVYMLAIFPSFFFSPQSLDSDLSDGPISVQEFLEVKNALSASEAKIQQLMKANSNLSEELRLMQKKVPEIQQWVLNTLVRAAFLLLNKARLSNPYTCTSSCTWGGEIAGDPKTDWMIMILTILWNADDKIIL